MNLHEQTTIRAENNAKFYSRFKWLGLGAFAFGLWSVYDGVVTYPDQKVRAEALLTIAEENLSADTLQECQGGHGHNETYQKVAVALREDESGWEAWKSLASSSGWEEAPPTKLRTDGDIAGQFVMAGLCALATAYFVGVIIKTTGRWMELDDDRIHTSGGLSFPVTAVGEIDKRQWADKGIAHLKYEDNGRQKRFVIDNYKYIREETDAILYRVEQIAGVDKVVNGAAELTPGKELEGDATTPVASAAEPV
ncbi:MAG: hypothetical protein AAFV43_00100 [Planctomycetota bacterium]